MAVTDDSSALPRAPQISIPEEYVDGFRKLLAFPEEHVTGLLAVLRQEPPSLDSLSSLPHRIASKIRANMPSVSLRDAEDIADVVVSLFWLLARWEITVSDLAEAVSRAIDESGVEEFKLPGEAREQFKHRLVGILEAGSIHLGLKAGELLTEHEHTIHDARVLTDVRPVFGSNPEEPPEANVLVHMLKLSYHDESEEVKEIYVALDTGDVNRLISTLERANKKAESLKKMLEPTGVPYIDAK